MKKLLIGGLLAVVLGFGLSGMAMANPPVTSPAMTVGATVVIQLTIAVNHNLAFPDVIVQGGSKTVAPAGGGTGGAGQFTIMGSAGALVDISAPTTVPIIIGTGGTDEIMTVTLSHGYGQIGTVTLDTDGNHVVYVGGTVAASSTQVVGSYLGNFTITAVYL